MTKETIKVSGMTCGHCEAAVEKSLGALDGVASVRANHRSGKVKVSYETGRTEMASLKQAILDAGYEPQ